MSAFRGLRIIDFSQRLPGAMATMLFADFDAEVIKVLRPGGAKATRHPGFHTWDRNKSFIELNLQTFAGQSAARDLCASADVAVFDPVPGELERLGLDAVSLCAANPRLIHAWLPPYGTTGRWSYLPPDEMLLTAVTGIAHLQLSYEDVPVYLVTPQAGYAHATIAANAIAAALIERQESGRGQPVTISGLHAASSVECGGAVTSAGGAIRMARSSKGAAPHYRLYECADRLWFFLGTLTQPFFLKALEAIGELEVMAMDGVNGEFSNLFMPGVAPLVMDRLEARFRTRPRAEWLAVLREAGVPSGPAGTREEWFHGETVAANDMRLVLEHPELGTIEMPGVPIKMEGTPGNVRHLLRPAGEIAPREAAAQPPATTDVPGGGPLAGVNVLDLGAFIAGTFAPTVLANLGANVIKVEPLSGDGFRPYGLNYVGHNQGKRSIALDIKAPAGRAALEALVRWADVVLDNFRLGVTRRLGIDYASLRTIKPDIITCSVTGYGPRGELAEDPGFDPLMQARSGMMMAQGGGVEPVFHQIAVNDSATAMMAAFGMQAALFARGATGQGQEVHTCLANQSVLFQSGELTSFAGRAPAPLGGVDFLGPKALRRFYPVADGWVALACSEPVHFHKAATALGHPEWMGRMTAELALQEPPDGTLAELFAGALAGMTRSEAVDRLVAGGVPAAPVVRVEEQFTDPWLAANDYLYSFDDANFGRVTAPQYFARFGRSHSGFPMPGAARMGQHTVEALLEAGLSEEAVNELLASGVAIAG